MSTNQATALAGSPLGLALRDIMEPAVLTIEPAGKVLFTSRALELLRPLGTTSTTTAIQLPQPLDNLSKEVIAGRKAILGRRVELAAEGPARKWLQVSAYPVSVGRTQPQVVLVLHDLSALLRIEERLLQIDRLSKLGTLTAGMAHEIKNALVPCKTFIDVLLERHQELELAELVRSELKRVDELVSHMLKSPAPVPQVLTKIHIHQLLDHLTRILRAQFESKSINLTRTYEAQPDVAHGDPGELQQAFMNLLFNAIEAVGSSGTINLRTSSASTDSGAPQIAIAVEDTGVGMAPHHVARLFEPFFTTKADGTGLGLAITRRIIDSHHGRITVASTPGRGTCFEVFLPA